VSRHPEWQEGLLSAAAKTEGLSPGMLNPDVTQANIRSTICRHGWTDTIRPPTSYTNALKAK
jgi:hypothetical protein